MRSLIIPLPGNEQIAHSLGAGSAIEVGSLQMHSFPDGESRVRLPVNLAGRSVAFVCTLANPNPLLAPLLFAADGARAAGAPSVGLIAPYLAYMRQDKQFEPGDVVTSKHFAHLLSAHFDWIVTVDPHLHRYRSLSELYTIPAEAVHAAPLLSRWIRKNVPDCIVVGPDSESEQWVREVASGANAPFVVLEKTRQGDRDVRIAVKANAAVLAGRTPVLVDDIISSGETMRQAIFEVKCHGTKAPICLGIHGVFAGDAEKMLREAGARVVTSNSIPHATNEIDAAEVLCAAVASRLQASEAHR